MPGWKRRLYFSRGRQRKTVRRPLRRRCYQSSQTTGSLKHSRDGKRVICSRNKGAAELRTGQSASSSTCLRPPQSPQPRYRAAGSHSKGLSPPWTAAFTSRLQCPGKGLQVPARLCQRGPYRAGRLATDRPKRPSNLGNKGENIAQRLTVKL